METEIKNKIDVKKVLITITLVLFTAGAVGGGVYYVMNQNFKKEREANEKALAEINTKVQKMEQEEKKSESSSTSSLTSDVINTSSWKTYNNFVFKFNIKYPSEWLIKEYGSNIRADQSLMTCFAKTQSEFPPEQSDGACPVRIVRISQLDSAAGYGIKRESVIIAGKTATKLTIPANVPNRFGGWAEVIYIVPYYDSYLYFQNVNNYELTTFDAMVNSISFY